MSQPALSVVHFEGRPIHTLQRRGRPAWSAREISALLGYRREGDFLEQIASESWALVPEWDYALLVGEELSAVGHQRPLLVLFESGLHLALVLSGKPGCHKLRRFLIDRVLSKLEPGDREEDETLLERIVALRGLQVDTEDRRFRYEALLHTAGELLQAERIDEATWGRCLIRACEVALDQPVAFLHDPPGCEWVTVAALAERLGVDGEHILMAARVLGLLERSRFVRPLAVHEHGGWRLTFRLSPDAVAQIEAWFVEASPEEPEIV